MINSTFPCGCDLFRMGLSDDGVTAVEWVAISIHSKGYFANIWIRKAPDVWLRYRTETNEIKTGEL